MNYRVKQNFKNARVYYKIGQIWQSDDEVTAGQLLKLGLIEPVAEIPIDMGKEEIPSPSPVSEPEMGEDLGGYEPDGSYVPKPKKGKKKKG